MTIKIIRGIFVLACIILGTSWANYVVSIPERQYLYMGIGGLAGAGVSVGVLLLLRLVTQDIFERMFPAVVAILLGMMTGYGVVQYVLGFIIQVNDPALRLFVVTAFVLVFGYIGIMLGLTRASNLETLIKTIDSRQRGTTKPKLVDTSVLIDGRIADICATGFIDGPLLVPRFVLHELQRIADSPDDLRRARGRRGLDIVKHLQDAKSKVEVEIIEDDPQDIREVDAKLVRLGRVFDARVMTNDLNLNKVAQIEGVSVLNINDLANALKPAVLPDERMKVRIVKEGKEAYQGVGYLDDGTMIVVDGGKEHLGRDVTVLVTSVLQTTAGRMIFTKIQEATS